SGDGQLPRPALGDACQDLSYCKDAFLAFVPCRAPEMHSLVLCASFGFTATTALLVAARRPLAAAAVTVAGVGWPATLIGGRTVAIGAVALAAALAIPLIVRASSVRSLAAGGARPRRPGRAGRGRGAAGAGPPR